MGYGKPETEVWLSKTLQRTRKSKENLSATRANGGLPATADGPKIRAERPIQSPPRNGLGPLRLSHGRHFLDVLFQDRHHLRVGDLGEIVEELADGGEIRRNVQTDHRVGLM